MTALTKIINCGNHPGDWAEVIKSDLKGTRLTKDVLHRGDSCVLFPGERAEIANQHHGSGESCQNHDAFAICTEGPGAEDIRTNVNPFGSNKVTRIKKLAAALYNEVEHIDLIDENACVKLMHAQNNAQDAILMASMLAVYAATVEAK